jgi:spore germination cell wall hydrolase CwlJ-like protein
MNTITPINKKVFTEINSIRLITRDLYKQKKLTYVLEKKHVANQKKLNEKRKLSRREESQETSKSNLIPNFLKQQNLESKSFQLYDLIKFLVLYKAIDWIANPKNLAAVQNMVKAIAGIAKVINFFAGIGVEGVFGGLHSILFGGSILERIFGIFKLMGGIFILRRILKPQVLLKDLNWIFKNRKGILDIFKNLRIGNFKKSIEGIFKVFTPNLFSIFKKGLGLSIKRVVLKVFGKGGLRFITAVASKLGFKSAEAALKGSIQVGAKSLGKSIPIVGPIIGLGINLLLGDPLDKAVVKLAATLAGQAIGGLLMGLIGSVVPVAGTAAGAAVGSAIGGLIGDWLGGVLYDGFKNLISPKNEPALAVGGIVTRPTRALIGEAGPEAVIPLPQLFGGSIFNSTFGLMGASIIGGVDAVLSSMGSVGSLVRPFATQLLSPYAREFGVKQYVFNSDIGKASGKKLASTEASGVDSKELKKIIGTNTSPRLLNSKDSNPRARYNTGNSLIALLGDIFNNIINLDSTTGGTAPGGGGVTGDTGDLGGEVDLSSADDQTLLKQLALAEAAGEGKLGMALVINSVLNRKRILDSGKSPSFFGANDNTIRGIIYGGNGAQYQPVANGSINKQWGEGSLKLAQEALELARDKAKLSRALGEVANKQYLLGATGFRAGSAFDDPSQNVNVTKYGNHYFNTAGNLKMNRGGVVNPVPSQNIATNKGGYAADTGLDIFTPIGSRIVSPVSGVIEYAEKGHVRQMGQDANPNMPGMQDQHSVRIRLDTPFKYAGKQVNFFYATHLYQLNSSIANKSGVRINAGDLLGLSGVANNVPHVHVGFVGDRNQTSFLNYQQVRSLLTGAPVQDAGQSAGSPDGPSGNDSQQDMEKAPDWGSIAKELGDLYKSLTGVQKLDANSISTNSMNMLQSKNITPVAFSDTYIVGQGSTTIANVNVVNPLTEVDWGAKSFSRFDSSSNYLAQNRL